MAFIKLKDYLESLTTKGSISNSDLLPLLDSDASNAIKTVTKGTLVSLDDISGFTQFSQSVENQLANSSQFSESLDDTFAKDVEVATTASLINSSITTLTNNVSTTASLFDSSITQVSTDLSDYETDNTAVVRGIQSYTGSLKQAISVAGTDVTINGTLTTTNFFAQYVTSSFLVTTGSNQFGDNTIDKHEFTGSVYFADTVYLDGEPIGITALNAFSSSVNNSIIQIGNHTASIDNSVVQIGNHTSSVDNSVILFGAHTASQTTINSGISAVTGAFATELGEIQTTLTGHRNELNGIEAWTASLDDTFATDAQLYRLYQATRSLELNSGSVNNSVTLIGEHTASVDNSVVLFGNHTASVNNSITLFGEHTASQTTINSGISAVTGAFATELGGIQTQLTNRRDELNGLEAYTSSLKSVSIVSGSSQIDVTQTTNYSNINQYTDSDNTSHLNSLLVVSKSVAGDLDVNGSLTASVLQLGTSNGGNVIIDGNFGSVESSGAALSNNSVISRKNTFIGFSGRTLTSGSDNIGIGSNLGNLTGNTRSDDNIALGRSAGDSIVTGSDNIAIGGQALQNSDEESNGNVAIGSLALFRAKGDYNTAIGHQAAYNAGLQTTAIGAFTGFGLKEDANYNTAIGYGSVGGSAAYNQSTGDYNTGTGYRSLQDITSGGYNVGLGGYALQNVNTGIGNVGVGYATGTNLTGGSYNILLGWGAGVASSNYTNTIVIGKSAISNGSNTVVIGNDDITNTYLKGNISGSSLHISQTATLVSQDPLPTGAAGMLAVSSSASNEKLYFYDGSSWREVSLV